MELGATDVLDAVQLPRADVPLELQKNFNGLRNVPLFYSAYCRKLSHKNKVQNRVLLATLDHLYCCHPNGDILRCFPFSYISRIIHDPERRQIGIVVPKEYDLLIAVLDTFHFLHVIYTLRMLHGCDTLISVELVKRSALRPVVSVGQRDGNNGGGEQGGGGAGGVMMTSSAPMKDTGSVGSGSFAHPPSSTAAPGSSNAANNNSSNARGRGSSFHNNTTNNGSSGQINSAAGQSNSGSSNNANAMLHQQSFLAKIFRRWFVKPPPGVIPGWNDEFANSELDDGSGEHVAGGPQEVCIGKGVYALRLAKPEGFQLSLYNVSTDGW